MEFLPVGKNALKETTKEANLSLLNKEATNFLKILSNFISGDSIEFELPTIHTTNFLFNLQKQGKKGFEYWIITRDSRVETCSKVKEFISTNFSSIPITSVAGKEESRINITFDNRLIRLVFKEMKGFSKKVSQARTKSAESLQCWVTASMVKRDIMTEMDLDILLSDKQEYIENFTKVLNDVSGVESLEDGWKFLEHNSNWIPTLIATGRAIIHSLATTEDITFHRSSKMLKVINDTATELGKAEGFTYRKDKWNPGDVWVISNSIEKIPKATTLKKYNKYFLERMTDPEQHIMSISIKKIVDLDDVKIETFKNDKIISSREEKISIHHIDYTTKPNLLFRSISADVSFLHEKNQIEHMRKLNIRSFDILGSIHSEFIEHGRRQGKISTTEIETFLGNELKLPPCDKNGKNKEDFFEIIFQELNKQFDIGEGTLLAQMERTAIECQFYCMAEGNYPNVQVKYQGSEGKALHRLHSKAGAMLCANVMSQSKNKQAIRDIFYFAQCQPTSTYSPSAFLKIS